MEEAITITKPQLAAALGKWQRKADEEGWPPRHDPEVHSDAAAYLFEELKEAGAQ
ncbi:MAG: hypothetical protein AAFY42_12880 [Pseudomonadota bacterium]